MCLGQNVGAHHERGTRHVNPFAGALFHPAIGGKVVPKVEQRRAPPGFFPSRAIGDTRFGRGGQGHSAITDGGGINPLAVHENALTVRCLAKAIAIGLGQLFHAIVANEIGQRAAHRGRDALVGPIGERIAQHRDGDAAVIGVGGNKRVKRFETNRDWNLWIGQLDLCKWIGRGKRTLCKARQAVIGRHTAARTLVFGYIYRPFERPGDGWAASRFGVQSKKRLASSAPIAPWDKSLGRAVHQFPVAQISASTQ